MKMVKSLLLGAAAGIVAVAGAQAADLPVKAKPVQYVKICSLYGAGFYYIPGTDTCLKVGGFVRAEANVNANGSFAQLQVVNFDDRNRNKEVTRVRALISLDARSQTEYGTLRSYANFALQTDNGTGGAGGTDVRTWQNRAFIQLAGFTAGLTDSFFDFDNFRYSNQTNVLGSNYSGSGIDVFAYTAQFGNGFSATLSVEDTQARRTAIFGTAGNGYGGRQWPDVVANLRIDQAWGSAQIMGAIHDVNASYYTVQGLGHPGDELGWAVGGGVKLNLPWAKGDYVIAQVNYTEGALNYVGEGLGTYAISDGSVPKGTLTTAFGPVFDSTYGLGTDQDLTKAWSVTGGIEHHWSPQWKSSLYAAFGQFDYSAVSSARLSGVAGSDADWSLLQVGSRTVWAPVPNLNLSVDIMYNKVDTAFDNIAGFEDKDWVAGIFRAQRNFWP